MQLLGDELLLLEGNEVVGGRAELHEKAAAVGADLVPEPGGGVVAGGGIVRVAAVGVARAGDDDSEQGVAFCVAEDGLGAGGVADEDGERVASELLLDEGQPERHGAQEGVGEGAQHRLKPAA